MNILPLKYKIAAIVFSFFLIVVPLSKINNSFEIQGGVYICGPSDCLDQSPNHLSYYCGNHHKYLWETNKAN